MMLCTVSVCHGVVQEGSVADEVLRQLCPLEAQLLADSTLHPRVRFRYATCEPIYSRANSLKPCLCKEGRELRTM